MYIAYRTLLPGQILFIHAVESVVLINKKVAYKWKSYRIKADNLTPPTDHFFKILIIMVEQVVCEKMSSYSANLE